MPSEALVLERLGLDDVDGGLALSDAAGWNQTADDWRLFLAHGHALGCRDGEGRLVASAAALPYDARCGWVSMVLVDAAWRHRGLATSLLGACVDHLRQGGRAAVLDATPAGAPVYRRLGFAAGFAFTRWQGVGGAAPAPSGWADITEIDVDGATDVDAIAALDAEAGGVARSVLLRDVLGRPGTAVFGTSAGDGVVVARAGRRATQVGPLVAASDADAVALVDAARAGATGPVFIDVPERCTALQRHLGQRGFEPQRAFTRMALGGGHLLAARERVHALAGPEFG